MELNDIFRGPMVGGTDVQLDPIRDSAGRVYLVLLQFGGEVPRKSHGSQASLSSRVRIPPVPPNREPHLTFMLSAGGPRESFAAAGFVESARCGLGLITASLWDDGQVVSFTHAEIAKLAAAIEQAVPEHLGGFAVQWTTYEDDGVPF